VERMLAKIDLPELVFEVHGWTGYLDAFVHLGDGTTRMGTWAPRSGSPPVARGGMADQHLSQPMRTGE